MRAVIKSILNGAEVKVHATANHPASSYGKPVWVDDDENAYCQVGMEAPFYEILEKDE